MMLGRATAVAFVLAGLSAGTALAQFPPPPGASGAGQPAAAGDSPFDRPSAPFTPAPAMPGAQSPFDRPPAQFTPPQQAGPGPAPGRGGEPPCFKDFMPLREEAQKRANAVQAASKRKAPPSEACQLLGRFTEAEARVVKFVEANGSSCGIPNEVLTQLKTAHGQSLDLRKKVCAVAQQQPQRPAGPSLSDALGTSRLPDPSASTKPGRNTFDTMTGNVLTR